MAQIPTTEEVIAKIVKFESTNDTIECTVYSLSQLMIKFAKMHVEAALKEASKKSKAKEGQITDYKLTNSILNSYPLENIK